MIQEVVVDCYETNWEDHPSFPSPAKIKVLRYGLANGLGTFLLWLPPDSEFPPHCHLSGVEHYVVQGEYEMDGQRFGPGIYRHLPPHAMVNRIQTKQGVTILVICDPEENFENRFKGLKEG